MYKIMIVDDEENVLKSLKRLFRSAPCYYEGVVYELDVETYLSPITALASIGNEPYALVLADYRMPEMDGAEFLRQVRERQPHAVRMILSGYADLNGLMKAINEAQIARFIAKPWNDYELITAIGQGLAYRDMLLENIRLADECRVEKGLKLAESLTRKHQAGQPAESRSGGQWSPDGAAIYDDTSHWFG